MMQRYDQPPPPYHAITPNPRLTRASHVLAQTLALVTVVGAFALLTLSVIGFWCIITGKAF